MFIEERNNSWNTPYLFNAKELDEETGLYYYGARYYNPRTSVWLSTDPLQEKYPNISTYAYCIQNPVKFIDLDGKEPIKSQAASLSQLINALQSNNAQTLKDILSLYGGINTAWIFNVENKAQLNERYVYSTDWGWIDMRHFAASAYGTDIPFNSVKATLDKGERTEVLQERSTDPGQSRSAWSYEDLVSNALGAYFQSYARKYDGTDVEALNSFFKEIGVVENPLEVAPNILPEVERQSPPQNTTYKPKFIRNEVKRGTSDKIVKFIEEYTDGVYYGKDRRTDALKKIEKK